MTKPGLKPPLHLVEEKIIAILPDSITPDSARMIWNHVLQEMCLLMWPPFSAPTEHELVTRYAFTLRAYVEDLSEYPFDVVQHAWKLLRRRVQNRRWPAIADFRIACTEALTHQKINGTSDKGLPFWQKHLQTCVEPLHFSSWIRPLSLHGVADRVATFHAPSALIRDWARRNYEHLLLESIRTKHSDVTDVLLQVAKPAINNLRAESATLSALVENTP